MKRSRDLLLVAALVTRTDGPLQSDDLVECDADTDVENSQHGGLSRRHSVVAITGDQDDAVELIFERVDPVRQELAVDSGYASIAKVLGIL